MEFSTGLRCWHFSAGREQWTSIAPRRRDGSPWQRLDLRIGGGHFHKLLCSLGLFLLVAAGEAARSVAIMRRNKRLSGKLHIWSALYSRIWVAMAIAATPLIAYLPLIQHSISEFGPYAWNKVSMQQVTDSYTEMVEVVLFPILALFILGIALYLAVGWLDRICPDCRERLIPRWLNPLLRERPAKICRFQRTRRWPCSA